MRAFNELLIECKDTHVTEKGSIQLITRLDNSALAKQVFPVHSIPKKYEDRVKPGDQLIVHFNVVVKDYTNEVETPSNYHIKDDIYRVPENMIHGVMREDGSITMWDNCHLVIPIKRPEKKTDSGIIYELNNNTSKMKKQIMYGYIKVSETIDVGSKIILSNYSDYEISIPGHDMLWLVQDSSIIAIDED